MPEYPAPKLRTALAAALLGILVVVLLPLGVPPAAGSAHGTDPHTTQQRTVGTVSQPEPLAILTQPAGPPTRTPTVQRNVAAHPAAATMRLFSDADLTREREHAPAQLAITGAAVNVWLGIAGVGLTLLGLGGWFVSRSNTRAQKSAW